YWENCLTVPRALRAEGGRIYQTPAEELTGLRGDPLQADPEGQITLPDGAGDIIASWPEKPDGEKIWKIIFGNDDAVLTFSEGVLSLQLSEKAGCGRTIRKCRTGDIHTLRILADTSILEIYINDGAYVMTTRFYPDYAGTDPELTVRFEGSRPAVSAWAMQTMQTNILY
ncbi:MAG: GH32 C-terminal domain-containing protein, partial [Lachnospiraceae bacterium]|nr:GH32 C-terminal domain-containing protein [Lachnospiraceae bacterium]